MRNIFKLSVLVGFLSLESARACDDYLMLASRDLNIDIRTRSLFARDCAMQDRYTALRNEFQNKYSIRVSDLAEYKSLRFIDRNSWEQAKVYSLAPNQIYKPAPVTWDVWAGGIDQLFLSDSNKGQLTAPLITTKLLSKINQILLTDGRQSIKDAETDEQKMPGDFRREGDNGVFFCDPKSQGDYNQLVESHRVSLLQVQKRAERALGDTFKNLFKKSNIDTFTEEQIGSLVRPFGPGCGKTGSGHSVSYARSDQVQNYTDRLVAFTKINLERYKMKKPLMPPTEFSLFVQRWLVTIHPFADGNGRTSRGLQDLILAHFDLPFVPSGDLQNDVLANYDSYVEETYKSMESMLNYLDQCLAELNEGKSSFSCKTTHELNGLKR